MAARTRILALLALVLPGLLLSGATHLCVCLGELLGSGDPCAAASADCCERFDGGAPAAEPQGCSDCCIVVDVDAAPPIAPAPAPVASVGPLCLAPAPLVCVPVPEVRDAPFAREAPAGLSPPGRAPIPLRI